MKQDTTNFPPLQKTPVTVYSENEFSSIMHQMNDFTLPTDGDTNETISKWELNVLLDTPVKDLELDKPVPAELASESLAPSRPRGDSIRSTGSNSGHKTSKSPRKNSKKPTAAEIAAKAAALPPPPVVTEKSQPAHVYGKHAKKDKKDKQDKEAVESTSVVEPAQPDKVEPAAVPAAPKPVESPVTSTQTPTSEEDKDKLSFVEVIKKSKGSKKHSPNAQAQAIPVPAPAATPAPQPAPTPVVEAPVMAK